MHNYLVRTAFGRRKAATAAIGYKRNSLNSSCVTGPSLTASIIPKARGGHLNSSRGSVRSPSASDERKTSAALPGSSADTAPPPIRQLGAQPLTPPWAIWVLPISACARSYKSRVRVIATANNIAMANFTSSCHTRHFDIVQGKRSPLIGRIADTSSPTLTIRGHACMPRANFGICMQNWKSLAHHLPV